MRRALLLIALLCASMVPCVAATDGPPAGWILAGNHPENYKTGRDEGIAFLTSKQGGTGAGFGTLMQSVRTDEYVGKRIRFRATLRSEDVTGWAGLWMRVDQGSKMVAFDNMQTRPIKGTTGWTTYEVVLDVPPTATNISFGALVASNGGIWLREVGFGPVGLDVPTTGNVYPLQPVNLDFRR